MNFLTTELLMSVEVITRRQLLLVWAVVWQSVLLCGVVWLLAAILRNAAPRVRHWLWMALAIKLLLMPLWFVGTDLPTPAWLPEPTTAARTSVNLQQGLDSQQESVAHQNVHSNEDGQAAVSVAELLERIGLDVTDATTDLERADERPVIASDRPLEGLARRPLAIGLL